MASSPPLLTPVEPPQLSPYPLQPTSSSPLASLYNRFASWRSSLGLSNPGTVENLTKEVKSTSVMLWYICYIY